MLKYKVAQNFPKVAQIVRKCMKMDVFKTAQNVNIHLGYLCKKICHQELSKIPKSGHTAMYILLWVNAWPAHPKVLPGF